MDLMAFVPNVTRVSDEQPVPTIVHNCEQPKEEDQLRLAIKGDRLYSKIRRWVLRKRMLSRKHPFTRWCLKSKTAINYENNRHLRSYPYMIHPFSSFRVFLESVMTVFTFIVLLITPVLVSFYFDQHKKWHAFNNTMNAVFLVDIAIWFFTGYYDRETQTVVLDPRIVASKYLRGYFVIDIIPVLPLELLEYIAPEAILYCVSLNLLKILRMRTVIIYGRRLRYVYRTGFQFYKILEMTVIIVVCVHWAACLEYYVPVIVAKYVGINEESWIESDLMKNKDTTFRKYLACANRAVTGLVCSKHFLSMKTPEDMILNLILTVIGFLGFIYLLAQFLQLMTTFRSTSKRHFKLIQQLQEYMRYKELPQFLQRRLLTFYNYRNKKGFERNKRIINQVSPHLREELLLHNYLNVLTSVELFKHLPQTIVIQLATLLRSEIFMANEVIVKAGTHGDALYFIASGTVAVYTSMEKEVCHLEDGAHFGEIALVMENEHRIATVVAVEISEINILSRANFLRVISSYPQLLDRLQIIALERLEHTLSLEETFGLNGTVSEVQRRSINISSVKGKIRNYK